MRLRKGQGAVEMLVIVGDELGDLGVQTSQWEQEPALPQTWWQKQCFYNEPCRDR